MTAGTTPKLSPSPAIGPHCFRASTQWAWEPTRLGPPYFITNNVCIVTDERRGSCCRQVPPSGAQPSAANASTYGIATDQIPSHNSGTARWISPITNPSVLWQWSPTRPSLTIPFSFLVSRRNASTGQTSTRPAAKPVSLSLSRHCTQESSSYHIKSRGSPHWSLPEDNSTTFR